MTKYHVYHSTYEGTRISTIFSRCGDRLGTYNTFREAKRAAVDAAKSTIECFKIDLLEAKANLKEIRSFKKSDLNFQTECGLN